MLGQADLARPAGRVTARAVIRQRALQVPQRAGVKLRKIEALVAGNPARVIRALDPATIIWRNDGDGEYQRLADRSLADLVEVAPLDKVEDNRPRNRGDARAVRLKT